MKNTFEYYYEGDGFHFKYAVGEPTLKNREFYDYNEFVLFMDGSSRLLSKNIREDLTPGSIVIIPKESYHQFCVTDEETYKRCVLGFRDTPELSELIAEIMNEIKLIRSPDPTIVDLFNKMTEIVKTDLSDGEKLIFIKSCLHQLLIYLKLSSSEKMIRSENLSNPVSASLSLIDEWYHEELTVERIAKALFISPSALSHKFKEELGISVYRYISKKRLMEAHKLIAKGETMSAAAQKCGFADYSCFYRLHKKYYGNQKSKIE